MGMTLWIHTLVGRNMSRESDDHILMHDLAEELDLACDSLGQPRLSSFFDTTDFEYNMADEFGDEAFDEDAVDAGLEGEADLRPVGGEMPSHGAAIGLALAALDPAQALAARNQRYRAVVCRL